MYCNRTQTKLHLGRVSHPASNLTRLYHKIRLFLTVEGCITSSLDALSRRLGMAVCAADIWALRPQGIRFALLGEQWHVWMSAEVAG